MIRGLRKRFILSAMAAFGILLAILVAALGVSSYLRLADAADRLMEETLSEHWSPDRDDARKPEPIPEMRFFQGQNRQYIAHYIVSATDAGEILSIQERGIWEADEEAAAAYARQVIPIGQERGRIDGFRYRMRQQEDGSLRIILLDDSMQLHMLADMLESAGLGCLAFLLMLFLILLPISNRVVASYARNMMKQKQFITNAGHEIKTPVAIILSNIDAMELIQGENKWSRNIRSQTDRLNLLLQRLLFMARIDERSVALPMETLALNSLIEAELETYAPILSERKLRLDFHAERELRLRGNREYLQQLVHMLMDNAVQYANEGGEIRIRMERRQRRVRILLSNSVDSLPSCPPESLFDRFYRGDSARTQSSGGCGIGLSAAQAIAEMHQGSIRATYSGDNTICFTVELHI